METRGITEADTHWITKILTQDSVFVAKKEIFYSALGLASGELDDLRKIVSFSGSQSYDFCSGCLSKWISKNGSKANMQKLVKILRDEDFINCADIIIAKDRQENRSKVNTSESEQECGVWFDVREAGDSFTGRESELQKLHELVVKNVGNDGSVTVISQLTSVTGLGGIGKTSLARKYAFDNAEYFDGNVIWINAETANSLKDSFQRLAKKLRIQTHDQNETMVVISTEDYAEKVDEYFQGKKCLFIFDNVEEFKRDVENILPKFRRGATYPHILMTSRKFQIVQKVKVLRLDVLEKEEALKLVKDELELEDDGLDELIKELVTKLWRLPLALQQAIAHIRKMSRFHTSDNCVKMYLELFDKNATNLLRFEFYKYTTDSYAASVYVTWLTTLQRIESSENGRFTIDLMNMIAYFQSDVIEMDIFLSTFPAEEVYESIQILHDYSMINESNGVLSVHRLVQEVIRITLVENKLEQQCLHRCLKTLSTGVFNWEYNKHTASVWKFALKYDELVKEFAQVGIQIMRIMAWRGTGITTATTRKFIELFGGKSTYQLQLRCAQIRTLIFSQSRDIEERLLLSRKWREREHFFCGTCWKSINAATPNVPKLCLANGFEFPTIPPALTNLTQLEERLVALRLPFVRIRSLGADRQFGMQGNIVNVMNDLDVSAKVLPRQFDQSSTVQVMLMRRLCYKRPFMYEVVPPTKVFEAAKYLANTALYKADGVILSEDWRCSFLQCTELLQVQDKMNFVVDAEDINRVHELENDSNEDAEHPSVDKEDDDEHLQQETLVIRRRVTWSRTMTMTTLNFKLNSVILLRGF